MFVFVVASCNMNEQLDKVKIDSKDAIQIVHKLMTAAWSLSKNSPIPMSLSRAYELQRDAFFYIMDIGIYEKISQEDMVDPWKDAAAYENMRDLLCETVARRNISVGDYLFVFSTIEDLLKYALLLDKQLQTQRDLNQVEPTSKEVKFE